VQNLTQQSLSCAEEKFVHKTKSQDIVNDCMLMFNYPSAEGTIRKKNGKFLNNYAAEDN